MAPLRCSRSRAPSAAAAVVLVAFASGAPLQRPPPIPTFSASAVSHNQTLVGLNSTIHPRFRDIIFQSDNTTNATAWQLTWNVFGMLGPAFEYLQSKQTCGIGGKCMVWDRNGTQCYEGLQANLWVLISMLDILYNREGGTHMGSGVVEGDDCEQWRLEDASLGNLSVCIRADGVWRSLVVQPTIAAVGWSNVFSYSMNLTSRNIRLGSRALEIEPIACPTLAPRACKGNGTSVFQVLRASNGEPWGELQDRDTFDWQGLPVTLGISGFDQSKYLEVFDVEANTSYGPLRDCNYNPNLHKNVCASPASPELAPLVGRSSAEQLTGALGRRGQCDGNDVVGSWFTFPHKGECANGTNIGDGGCTWKTTGAKVVYMDCVQDQAVQKAWAEEYQHPPFPKTLAAAKDAIAKCPEVRLV